MCGLTGFWELAGKRNEQLQAQIKWMTDALLHRGPDDEGFYVDKENGLAQGFRRLAILDLSPSGHQPMFSASGRYIMTFNGEIYNFGILKQQLGALGHRFRGGSDTEVMLAAFEEWGLESAVKHFAGMFAFSLWDRVNRSLSLARDRLGIKPMYYGWMGRTLLWGSELKAICRHPDFRQQIDRRALTLFMRHGYVPSPHTIYQGIAQLPAGHIVTIRSIETDPPTSTPYWSAKQIAEQGVDNPFEGSEHEAINLLEQLLRDIVRDHMIADVPLGAFLSGGVDSSTVVALMQAQSDRPVKTFSIGFYEDKYNEATDALKVAQHLETDHTELYITPSEAQTVIPLLPTMYDEPFGDSSQIPVFLVSQLARRHVTVSLSGDGGDELFGGYGHYFAVPAHWRKLTLMPLEIRKILGWGLRSFARTKNPHGWAPSHLDGFRFYGSMKEHFEKLINVIDVERRGLFHHHLRSQYTDPVSVVVDGYELPTDFADTDRSTRLPSFMDQMMHSDLISYLPNDLLTKVDRASMAVSLESRVPLLDHRIVEFAWQLPLSMKIRDKQSKWILRQVLYKHVPQHLIDRPKKGFGIPVGMWIRGPLYEWAESLLHERRLREEGFFEPKAIRAIWSEHLSEQRDYTNFLWSVLMFQAWWEQWRVKLSVHIG